MPSNYGELINGAQWLQTGEGKDEFFLVFYSHSNKYSGMMSASILC